MNILEDIKKHAGGEKLVWTAIPEKELAKRECSHDYGSGTGGFDEGVPVAYSKTLVFVVMEYDGQEWIKKIRRNPEKP